MMFLGNLFKHVWNKVYFNTDLPQDRDTLCDLDIDKALFEFLVPTTKRKNSISQWLGSPDEKIKHISDLDAKAVFLIIIDILLYIPRLALNIIKLVTEILPLTLRELAYAAFNSMLEGAEETTGIPSGLYKLAAGVCWLPTSLLSLIYLLGGLLTSPGMTILSMLDTLNELKCPILLNLAICGFFSLSVFAFHLAMIVIFAPIILPVNVLIMPERLVSGWVWGGVFGLSFFGLSGLIFNNNPDSNILFLEGKTASLSIHPAEFLRIFGKIFYQNTIWPINENNIIIPAFQSETEQKEWAAEQYAKSKKYQNENDTVMARTYCQLAADYGHATAQVEWGDHIHHVSKSMRSRDNDHMEYYELAARQGHSDAQFKLGQCYEQKRDFEMAEQWYELAATQGNLDSKLKLAEVRYNIAMLNKNYLIFEKVISSCNSAIRRGENKTAWENLLAKCQKKLGTCYKIGLYGSSKDLKKAVPLLTAAAEQNPQYADSVKNLTRRVLL